MIHCQIFKGLITFLSTYSCLFFFNLITQRQGVPHLHENHYHGFHYHVFWLMYVQVGYLVLVGDLSTVPLT